MQQSAVSTTTTTNFTFIYHQYFQGRGGAVPSRSSVKWYSVLYLYTMHSHIQGWQIRDIFSVRCLSSVQPPPPPPPLSLYIYISISRYKHLSISFSLSIYISLSLSQTHIFLCLSIYFFFQFCIRKWMNVSILSLRLRMFICHISKCKPAPSRLQSGQLRSDNTPYRLAQNNVFRGGYKGWSLLTIHRVPGHPL